ncbi:MAG: hypothetical protein IJE45_03940 [Bacilli bacterium]|nr:hypothetical protein [Bacilli bacterium]
MEKKFKWPKFLTVKRTILLAVLVLAVTILLIYFLGGYKEASYSSETQPFDANDEALKEYDYYLDIKEADVEKHNNDYITSLENLTAANIVAEIDSYINKIITEDNKERLLRKFTETYAGDKTSTEFVDIENKIKNAEFITDKDYALELLGQFEFLYKNNNYAFYFNYRYTTFRIDSIENGDVTKVLNTWYSNPQLEGNDPNSSSPNDTRMNHLSPIVINFLTKKGEIKRYTAFEYSITDVFVSNDDKEPVTPTFQVKTDKDNFSTIVYYELSKKGTTYSDYPQYISKARYDELVERNTAFVQEQIDILTGYLEEENIDAIYKYVKDHKDNGIITNYFDILNNRSLIGIEAYKAYKGISFSSSAVDSSNYNSLISSISTNIEELYKLACEMVRVEYQFNYKAKNGLSIGDKVQFQVQYKLKTETVTDDNGEETENKFYEFESYSVMASPSRKILSQILYTRLQYTAEDLANDQSEFGVENNSTNATYKVALEYKLTEKGLTTTVLNNSIYESNPESFPLYTIDILPYFTSEICEIEKDGNVYETKGDMVVPDGSGALIELNNGKQSYTQYSKRVYSTDLAFGNQVKQSETADILLPMYAITSNRLYDVNTHDIIKNSSAIIARLSSGAAQSSVSANVSRFTDSYNKIYFSTTYRESQLVTIGTGYYAKEITKFTEEFVKVDTVVDYYMYSSKDMDYDYADVAKEYRKVLETEGILTATNKDTTDTPVFNAELLGVYDFTTNFLGIVYSGHDTLTTYDQAVTILKDLKTWGATNINVIYRGWRDSGLVNETFKDMSFANKLGSKKEYNNFLNYLEQESITLYPLVSFLEINKFKDSFGKTRYSTRDVSSEYTEKYPYDLAGNIYDKKQNPYYTISPKFYNTFAEMLAKNFTKKNPELHAMAFDKLGGNLVGDYKKRSVFYKNESVAAQIDAFEIMAKDNRITEFSLNSPYEFAVKYATNITEVPYESTLHEVFNYSIPFYQLVFSGYKDYSGVIINANDEISLTKHLMNIFQTGSNIQFTFSYDNSSELIQTDYNYYYYTQHSQWKTEVTSVLQEVNKYELYKYQLADHELYVDQHNEEISGVYVVTYEEKANVSNTFKVYLNYSEKAIKITNKAGDQVDLPSWNYYVDKEAK